VINVPSAEVDANNVPVVDANGNVTNPGRVVIRMKMLDFTGAFV
jgi:hypothetical protein